MMRIKTIADQLGHAREGAGATDARTSDFLMFSKARAAALAVGLIGTTMLAGCSEGVISPQGPIASAEKEILFNSLGIMLAIVIPTIIATLGVAFWYRASNRRARYLPDFEYSG